jgi:transglutaminase-like putative cysteine protease
MIPSVPSHRIPLPVLLFFAAGLLLAAVPLIGQTSIIALTILGGSAILRCGLAWRGVPPPNLLVKLGILSLGIAAVVVQYGAITGIEPGLGVLVVLVSMKFLEAHARRDMQVLALLGYFILLCDLFFAQDLARWLYVGFVLAVLTIGLSYLETSGAPRGFRTAVLAGAKLVAFALPLIILLFLFFPRVYGGFRFQFSRSVQGAAGIDDRMQPGTLSALALRQDIAFRADFPDGNPPPQAELYWRGLVLWRGDGLNWSRGGTLPSEKRPNSLAGDRIRQRIVLQPHGARYMFALDRPVGGVNKATLEAGGFLFSSRPIYYPLVYEVISRPENRETKLLSEQRAEALRKPLHASEAVRKLAADWREKGASDAAVIRQALGFFQNSGFEYSLAPGVYAQNELDDFLFHRRVGFCEHYAGAFATLMRLAEIPSRVVIGYHGGQFNRHGNYVIVRQSDAHAWCEVFIDGTGWQRVDPTSVIAPDRISAGFESYLENQAAQGDEGGAQSLGGNRWSDALRDARLMWDSLAYRWDLWVLNFDEETQRSFLLSVGLGAWDWSSMAVMLAIALGVGVAVIGLVLRFTGRTVTEPVLRLYRKFCDSLERLGISREPWEGPRTYAQRASSHLPARAADIAKAADLYIQIRYSPHPPSIEQFAAAVHALDKPPAEPRQ